MSERTIKIDMGGGMKLTVSFVNYELFELMNVCDVCGRQGSLTYNLHWHRDRVICTVCRRMEIISET